ncbi:hypothetical protein AB4Z10_15470 [Bosea sp. RAF48]
MPRGAQGAQALPAFVPAVVIARIVAGHPQSQIGDLLPWAYAPQQLKAVA